MHRVLLLGFVLIGLAYGETIDNNVCTRGRDARNHQSEVHEIRVIPCAEADTGEPCRLQRGTNATIEVDFTPSRNGRRMKQGMAWMSRIDLPFKQLPVNACTNSLSCPLRANNKTTFSANVPLGRNLPVGSYPIKLKLYEGTKIFFCQTFSIKLEDAPVDIS